jgi:hypothetical protein
MVRIIGLGIINATLPPAMTQPNLLELAKQGNAQAIATLMNRQLQPQGITIKAALKDNCLQMMLQSTPVSDREEMVAFVRKGLTTLGVAAIARVKIYGRQTGEDVPAWSEEFELAKQTPPTLKERARQRHVDAITTLLNRALAHKSITAKAILQADCLQVMLESALVPDEQVSTTLIRRELTALKVDSLKTVKLYGRQIGEEFPAWNKEFELVSKTLSTSRSETSSQTNPDQPAPGETSALESTPVFKKLEQAVRIFASNAVFFSLIVLTIWVPIRVIIHEQVVAEFIEAIFWPIAVGAILHSTSQIQKGKMPNYPEAMSVGLRNWGHILLARFFAGFVILLGLMAFIIPGIIFYLQNALIDSVVVFEKKYFLRTQQRSYKLTTGKRWQILGAITLFGLGYLCFNFILYAFIQLPIKTLLRLDNSLGSFIFSTAMDFILKISGCIVDIILFLFYLESRQQNSNL